MRACPSESRPRLRPLVPILHDVAAALDDVRSSFAVEAQRASDARRPAGRIAFDLAHAPASLGHCGRLGRVIAVSARAARAVVESEVDGMAAAMSATKVTESEVWPVESMASEVGVVTSQMQAVMSTVMAEPVMPVPVARPNRSGSPDDDHSDRQKDD